VYRNIELAKISLKMFPHKIKAVNSARKSARILYS
jgi:hypothetical protein